MQERQRSWSVVWDWTSCRVKASFHAPSVALEWAATASSAMAANTGCTRNAVGSSTWKRTLTTDVHGARELHVPWMADHRRKSRSDLTSLRWPCVQLLCAERNAPCQWDLAIDKVQFALEVEFNRLVFCPSTNKRIFQFWLNMQSCFCSLASIVYFIRCHHACNFHSTQCIIWQCLQHYFYIVTESTRLSWKSVVCFFFCLISEAFVLGTEIFVPNMTYQADYLLQGH